MESATHNSKTAAEMRKMAAIYNIAAHMSLTPTSFFTYIIRDSPLT